MSSSLHAVHSVGQDMKPAGDHKLHASIELAFCCQQGALQRAEGGEAKKPAGHRKAACPEPAACHCCMCGSRWLSRRSLSLGLGCIACVRSSAICHSP